MPTTTRELNRSKLEALHKRFREAQEKLSGADQEKIAKSEVAQESYLAERQQLEIDKYRAELKRDSDEHAWRNALLDRLFKLVTSWLIAVVAVVVLSGIGSNVSDKSESPKNWCELWLRLVSGLLIHFKLSDTVLITFISSTTVSVIGLFLVAAKWLFRSKQAEDKKSE